MEIHKFKLGQSLAFTPGRFEERQASTGLYEVMRLMPTDGLELQYRVKNARDGVERVVRESQLALP
ncbi:MAG TPA: hypothetical protein VED40_07145 [Azospirillaceae bacterium]|nr:hypothetical protein [Azospirillaceae bacterium]